MKYVYSATGEKLAVQYSAGNVLTYNGGMVRDGNNSLKYILTGEGRYVMNGTSGTMEYHLADHLGNTRVVLNQAGEVIQANDYYPFGMLMAQSGSSTNRYLYNGKEAQEQTGWLDYGARMYDASLGRWFNMDPMAEEYTNLSPYNYCANNPVFLIDPNGMFIDSWIVDYSGYITYIDDDREDRLYVQNEKGEITSSMRVWNRDILDQLVNYQKITNKRSSAFGKNLSVAFGDESSQAEMLRTFLFLADHTKVEWRLDRYYQDGLNKYSLGTLHDSNQAPSPENMGYSILSTIAFIHSHPDVGTSINEELGSMGWNYKTKRMEGWSDMFIKTLNPVYHHLYYYTYFPNSKRLWHVEGGGRKPSLIRSRVNNYKRLLFGTLNTK